VNSKQVVALSYIGSKGFCRQKMPLFRSPKSANFVRNAATYPDFRQFRQISSKINIFVTTASFRHFVSFSSKTKSFGA